MCKFISIKIKLIFYFMILALGGGCVSSVQAEYIKVSNEGKAIAQNAAIGGRSEDWGCTYDSDRKLLWEIKTSDTGIHAQGWTYSWYDTNKSSNNGNEGGANLGTCFDDKNCDTEKFVKLVNERKLCGFNDWRMPTEDEMAFMGSRCASEINGWQNLCPDRAGNPDQTWLYWTGNSMIDDIESAKGIYLYSNNPKARPFKKSTVAQVRLVRNSGVFSPVVNVQTNTGNTSSGSGVIVQSSNLTGKGIIKGGVADFCTGRPLQFAQINMNEKSITQTNEAGQYNFQIPAGYYTLSINASGYSSRSMTVTVQDKQTGFVDFSLLPSAGCNNQGGSKAASFKGIIIAGSGQYIGSEPNPIWYSTQVLADRAYLALKKQGFGDANIRYLSASDLVRDADQDGQNDVYNKANAANLLSALAWAENVSDVVVYYVGHGGIGSWSIDENSKFSADELKVGLDRLQSKISGKLIVVVDACYAGSFVDTLNKSNRYVLASTTKNTQAIISNNGYESFSWNFWGEVGFSGSLSQAYKNSRQAMSSRLLGNGITQKAVMDADGNGKEEVGDYDLISKYCFGACLTYASAPPKITGIIASDTLDGKVTSRFVIQTDTTNPKAWATVMRPDFVPPADGTAIQGLPQFALQCNNAICEGEYSNFDLNGKYTLNFSIQDAQGGVSAPRTFEVVQSGRDEREGGSEAVYQSGTGKLILKNVDVGGLHYLAELQDMGGFSFALTSVTPLASVTSNTNAQIYDSVSKKVSIPRIYAGGQFYKLNLNHNGDRFNVQSDSVKLLN